MIHIRRVGVFSLARLFAVVYGGTGLAVGLLISLINFLAALLGDYYLTDEIIGTIFGAVCAMPVVLAVIGFIGGAVTAFLANLAFRLFGGLELKADVRETPSVPAAPIPVKTGKP